MSGQYNLRNPAVKRLMKEAQELREPTEQYFAQPLEDNLFEWHFTIRGPVDSEFEGGIYHGRITLPPEYPMKPPSIMLLTPNGRFETFKKICLSISGHHPESWQPSWSIRTALLAIIGFMPTHGNGAIGSLDYTAEERKVLSKRSLEWRCTECGSMKTMLKPVTEASKKTTEEAKELASQINFQGEKEKNGTNKEGEGPKNPPSAGAESAAAAGPSTTTSETSGAAAAAGSPPTTPLTPGFPPFNQAMFPPNFPTTMPNATMPSFMPRMMTPPGTGSAIPPFPRPFWPGMMPTLPGNGSMPARPPGGMMYPWPPMFNPMMMNAQMMAMMNQQMRWPTAAAATLPTSAPPGTPPTSSSSPPVSEPATPTSTVTSSSQSATSRMSTVTTTTATTSSSTSSSSAAAQPAVPAAPSPTHSPPPATTVTSTSAASVATTSSSSTTPTSTSAATSGSASAPAPGTTAEAGLRQRTATTVTGPAPAPAAAPAPAPTYGSAEVPAQTVRRGENPVVVMVMALLGLLIIALILRRLYNVVNAAAFDNDF